jgi:Flp pilus assembly pilin Flp
MQSPVAVAVFKQIAHTRRSEDGQDLLEYGLLAALIAVTALGAVSTLGQTIYNVLWSVIGNARF